jgi:hypothetical protein
VSLAICPGRWPIDALLDAVRDVAVEAGWLQRSIAADVS